MQYTTELYLDFIQENKSVFNSNDHETWWSSLVYFPTIPKMRHFKTSVFTKFPFPKINLYTELPMCLHRSQSVEATTCIKQPVLQDHRTDPGHTCSEIQACAWARSRIGNLKMDLLWGGLGALLRTLLSCCHLSWLAGNTPSAQKNLLQLQVLPSRKQSHVSLFSLQSLPSLEAPLSPQHVCEWNGAPLLLWVAPRMTPC